MYTGWANQPKYSAGETRHEDARAFEGRFAVADERVGHDVFTEFDATGADLAVVRRERLAGSPGALGFHGRFHADPDRHESFWVS